MRDHPTPCGSGVDSEDIILGIAEGVVKLVIHGSVPSARAGAVDPNDAIDGVLMGLAMVLDQAPEFAAPRTLGPAIERFGARILEHAAMFRDFHATTGVHAIDHLVDRFGRQGVADPLN